METKVAPVAAAAPTKDPIDTAIDTFFKNDDSVRVALSRNLTERSAATLKVAEKAKAAFVNFAPSKYTHAERTRRNFVAPDTNAVRSTRDVVDKGIEALRASAPSRAMKVHVNGGLKEIIDKGGEGSVVGKVPLASLIDYITAKAGTTLTLTNDAAFTECQAEMEAQLRLDQILGEDNNKISTIDEEGPPAASSDGKELTADELVSKQVRTQMATVTSPEAKLAFNVPARSDVKETGKSIETFELRAGPADVTSYHDFNNLQIAFEHVWTEIFDGKLKSLGEELYHEYVKLQEFVGKAPDDRSIDTIDDLRNLMAEIRELAKLTNEVTPAALQPKDGSNSSNPPANTTDVVVDVVQTVLDPASVVTNAIGDETVSAILNPAGAIIDALADLIKGTPQIKWSSFPGPLPGNGDLISAQIQENVAPAGVVEIELKTDANTTSGWKAIAFMEFDENAKVKNAFNISNDPNDRNVWDRNSYSLLPLYTPQVTNAMIEFHHEGMFRLHNRCFIMAGLSERLKDRSRVTFTWLKDR